MVVKELRVPTFLEDGGPVHLDNCLVGIFVLLAVTHDWYLGSFAAVARLFLCHNLFFQAGDKAVPGSNAELQHFEHSIHTYLPLPLIAVALELPRRGQVTLDASL